MSTRIILQGPEALAIASKFVQYGPMIGLRPELYDMSRGYDPALVSASRTSSGVAILILPPGAKMAITP